MGLHRCTEADCPDFGKPSARHCGCHKPDETVLREALQAILNEETVAVHVGYDNGSGGGNYLWADAVRTDSDAFVKARALFPSKAA